MLQAFNNFNQIWAASNAGSEELQAFSTIAVWSESFFSFNFFCKTVTKRSSKLNELKHIPWKKLIKVDILVWPTKCFGKKAYITQVLVHQLCSSIRNRISKQPWREWNMKDLLGLLITLSSWRVSTIEIHASLHRKFISVYWD